MRYAIALSLASLAVACVDRGPSDTVEQFYTMLERESEAGATYDMTVGLGREEFLIERTAFVADIDARRGLSAVTVLSEDLDGMTAAVEVLLVFGNGETDEFPVDLVRVDGQWKLRMD